MPDNRPLALVTGASSGIGRDFARILAREGHNLVLTARRTEALQELAAEVKAAHGAECTVIPLDLAQPDAAEQLVRQLDDAGLSVDVLINNAGFSWFGTFAEMEMDTLRGMIQVNIASLSELTRRLLPDMIERGRGRILNLASTAAFQAGPLMAVYYATKAYVLLFSEAVGNEAKGSGVTVTALCPGPTASGFQARAKMEESKLVRGKRLMTSALVAEGGYRAMMRGKPVHITGFANRVMAFAVRFLPRAMVTESVRRMQEA